MKKILALLFLIPGFLSGQANRDFREIAQKKIKAIYVGDTTYEDYTVYYYDRDGFLREEQMFCDYAIREIKKYGRDGISHEELSFGCLRNEEYVRTGSNYRCAETDTLEHTIETFDEKLRRVKVYQKIDMKSYRHYSEDSGQLENFECRKTKDSIFWWFEMRIWGWEMENVFTKSDSIEYLDKKYIAISHLNAKGDIISTRSFVIYKNDTIPGNFRGYIDYGNADYFYAENGVLLATECFIYDNQEKLIMMREEYVYKKNGELIRCKRYLKNFDSVDVFPNWYQDADVLIIQEIKNYKWINPQKKIMSPVHKKTRTSIPDYTDWLKERKRLFFGEFLFSVEHVHETKWAFRIEYWE
ncbi:MAG: hypothetical protein ACOZCO_14965 [Bacteroidota bacterium]